MTCSTSVDGWCRWAADAFWGVAKLTVLRLRVVSARRLVGGDAGPQDGCLKPVAGPRLRNASSAVVNDVAHGQLVGIRSVVAMTG